MDKGVGVETIGGQGREERGRDEGVWKAIEIERGFRFM